MAEQRLRYQPMDVAKLDTGAPWRRRGHHVQGHFQFDASATGATLGDARTTDGAGGLRLGRVTFVARDPALTQPAGSRPDWGAGIPEATGIETMVAPRRTNRVSMTGRLDTGNDYSQLRNIHVFW